MNQWEDLEKLQRDGEEMRKQLEQEDGIILLDDQEARDRLRSVLVPAFVACFEDFCKAGDLCLVYPFSMDGQSEESQIADCDGFSSRKTDPQTGKPRCAIGVSVEAMDAGTTYAVLVLLHELCHLIVIEPQTENFTDHSAHFHATLDELIEKYNTAYKTEIVNDYFGLAPEGRRTPHKALNGVEAPGYRGDGKRPQRAGNAPLRGSRH